MENNKYSLAEYVAQKKAALDDFQKSIEEDPCEWDLKTHTDLEWSQYFVRYMSW